MVIVFEQKNCPHVTATFVGTEELSITDMINMIFSETPDNVPDENLPLNILSSMLNNKNGDRFTYEENEYRRSIRLDKWDGSTIAIEKKYSTDEENLVISAVNLETLENDFLHRLGRFFSPVYIPNSERDKISIRYTSDEQADYKRLRFIEKFAKDHNLQLTIYCTDWNVVLFGLKDSKVKNWDIPITKKENNNNADENNKINSNGYLMYTQELNDLFHDMYISSPPPGYPPAPIVAAKCTFSTLKTYIDKLFDKIKWLNKHKYTVRHTENGPLLEYANCYKIFIWSTGIEGCTGFYAAARDIDEARDIIMAHNGLGTFKNPIGTGTMFIYNILQRVPVVKPIPE